MRPDQTKAALVIALDRANAAQDTAAELRKRFSEIKPPDLSKIDRIAAELAEKLANERLLRELGIGLLSEDRAEIRAEIGAIQAHLENLPVPQDGLGVDPERTRMDGDGYLVLAFTDGSEKKVWRRPKMLYGGGGGVDEARVLELIGENAGGGDVLLTYSAPTQETVTGTAADIVGTGSAETLRRVTVWVPNEATGGIYVNPAGTATSAHFLIPPGGHGIWDTNQALSAIRAGGSNVTAYVQVGVA